MFRKVTRERYLSDAELERFMAVVRGRRHVNARRDHAMFALIANTGMRPAEVRSLRLSDLNLNTKQPTVRLHRVYKRHAPQPLSHLVLHRDVAAVVAAYVANLGTTPTTMLFPFTKRQAARLFHYYAKAAGLPSSLRIYSLRHTCGMRLWNHTRDLRLVQAILGHGSLTATMGYEHTPSSTIRAGYAAAGIVR